MEYKSETSIFDVPTMFLFIGFIIFAILLLSISLIIRTIKLIIDNRSKSQVIFRISDLNLENDVCEGGDDVRGGGGEHDSDFVPSNDAEQKNCNDLQQQQQKNSIKADHRWIRCCSTIDRNLDYFREEFPNNIGACCQCKLGLYDHQDCSSSRSTSQNVSLIIEQNNIQHGHSTSLKNGLEIRLEYIGMSKYGFNNETNRHLRKVVQYFNKNHHENVATFLGIMIIDENDRKKIKQPNKNDCQIKIIDSEHQNHQRILMKAFSRNKINFFPKQRFPNENWNNMNRYYFVWHYPHNYRSLWDVIHGDIKLSWPIKISFINDMIQGLKFLHECNLIKGHGWINSKNCFINNGWQVKIFNYNRNFIDQKHDSKKKSQIFLAQNEPILGFWMPPEQLREPNINSNNNTDNNKNCNIHQIDAYSFAMLVYEIVCQKIPFDDFLNSEDEIPVVLDLIINGLTYKAYEPNKIPEQLRKEQWPLRPKICNHLSKKRKYQCLIRLMEHCWNEKPDCRPDFKMIDHYFKNSFKNLKYNSIEALINKLNKCRHIIDEKVRKRTAFLEAEKKKSDDLLYRLLPVPVAKCMKNGEFVKPEKYDNVTILFSDIVGFTTIASYSEPWEIISILNNLFAIFDRIVEKYDVYKVETIGDAYLAVSGLPNRNFNHAEQIGMVALEFLDWSCRFKIEHMPTIPLRIRVGIHSGSIVAGVVGVTNPRYCIFGDSVNIASRLESTGYPNSIHVSQTTEKWLRDYEDFIIQYRGTILLEGRGEFSTYWLLGRKGFFKESLPIPGNSNLNDNHGINNEAAFTSMGLFKQRL